jgi:hypothetical protein
MDDIPKMLRSEALIADEDWTGIYGISPNLAFAAADRIEKLEAALRKIGHLDYKSAATNSAVYDAYKIARKALEGKDD